MNPILIIGGAVVLYICAMMLFGFFASAERNQDGQDFEFDEYDLP